MEIRSVHVRLAAADWETLAHAAIRRRTSRGRLLLELAGPGIAELRRQEREPTEEAG